MHGIQFGLHIITLDYPNQQLIMEPNANYNKPDVYDRSGMWINQADGMFEVIDVVAKGPAAVAGIKAGDEILAVDGHAAQKITLSNLREKLRSRPGTKVRLTIKSGQQKREAEIVLCELV
jgi:C-terminal processing protease CtpA/Prc